MSAIPERLADAQHPWIGLASFTEGDREFFAGRGDEIGELLRLVRRDTLTLLYGVSGLGKTSLLQAGVFPAVRVEDYLPVLIRLDFLDRAPPLSAQVLPAISTAARAAGVEAPELRPDETPWEYFHREGNHFWSPRNDVITPFLVFDQFEEAFTLGRETPARIERVSAFITELADLVENRAPPALRDDPQRAMGFSFKPAPLRVLLAMREDYLADLDRVRGQFRALGQSRLRLLPMDEQQARQVIDLGTELLASGVADRIVAFAAGGTVSSPGEEIAVAPALLSLVLRELNERRLARGPDAKITPDLLDLEQQKILEDFYLRTLHDFPVGVRNFIEDELLTATGYRDSCALDDALNRPDVTQPILDELVNRRLLSYEDGHRVRRVEITHDVLAPVIKASRDARHAREALEEVARKQAEAGEREEAAQNQAEAREKERAARRRTAAVWILLVLAATLVASLLFIRSRRVEGELVDSFWRTVGVTLEAIPSYGERETLWGLSNSGVRQEVINKWVTTKSVERALANNARGLQAAIGLDGKLEADFTSRKAKGAADTLVSALTKPQETNPTRLWGLGNALATLAARLNPTDAAGVADDLTEALKNSRDTNSDRKSSLGNALAGLATRLNSAKVVTLAGPAGVLSHALTNPPETDAYRLWKLGTALAGLAARMNSSDAATLTEAGEKVLVDALKNPQETDPNRLWSLGDALAALSMRLKPTAVGEMASGLIDALPSETNPDRLSTLGNALAVLAAHLDDPAQAATLAKRGAKVLADALQTQQDTDPYTMWKLSNAFAALAARLDSNDAADLADDLAKAVETKSQETGSDRQSNLGNALAALAGRFDDPAQAATLAKRGAKVLADALLSRQETDPYNMWKLSNALAALAACLNPNDADVVAHDLAKALEEETNPDRQSSLGIALAALVARLDDPGKADTLAAPGAKVLADALEKLPETDSNRRYDLGNALAVLAAQVRSVPQTRLLGLSNLFLREVPKENAEGDRTRKTITEVCRSLKTEDLTEVLKWPFCVGEAQKLVLAALEKKTHRTFGGDLWKFVEQAPSLGIENLDRPAQHPNAEEAIKELETLRTKDK